MIYRQSCDTIHPGFANFMIAILLLDRKIDTYGTAQFKLDICTRVLVQSLEKFVSELTSFL